MHAAGTAREAVVVERWRVHSLAGIRTCHMDHQVIRRIVLKTTQRILVGWIAVAMSISAGFAHAGLPDGLALALWGSAAVGQQGGSGSIFSGFSSSPAATPSDPFAGRTTTPGQSTDANAATRLPPTDGAQPMNPQGTLAPGYIPRQPGQDGLANIPSMPVAANRVRSDALLKAARLALAVTDVRRAAALVAQARLEQAHYAANEDSPDRIEAAIARFVEISRLDRSTAENRKAYARMLMDQSETLLLWGELDQADKLAALAVEQQAAYGPFEAKPDDLLKRITALRQQRSPAGPLVDYRNGMANGVGPSQMGRQQAIDLMRQIRVALAANQVAQAEFLCRQLDALRIPESSFGPGEDRPGMVFRDVHDAMARTGNQYSGSSGVVLASAVAGPNGGVQQAVYDPASDPTRNVQVAGTESVASPSNLPAPPSEASGSGQQSPGYGLFQQGIAALKAHQRDQALQFFQQAAAYRNDLDAATAARLQDYLSLLSVPRGGPHAGQQGQSSSPADEAAAAQMAMLRQVTTEVGHREADARRMLEKDPRMALSMYQEARKVVENAGLEPGARDQLLRRIDRSIADTQQYIEQNLAPA